MLENIESLRFPMGKFIAPEIIDKNQIEIWIDEMEDFPTKLTEELQDLTELELEKTYRPNGWTITQIVNHCADSHINAFTRFKLALTENEPTVKPYLEDKWAELPDGKEFPVNSSLQILNGIHQRWTHLLRNLSEEQLERTFRHPEMENLVKLKTSIGMYAWHGAHHLGHIKLAKKNKNNSF